MKNLYKTLIMPFLMLVPCVVSAATHPGLPQELSSHFSKRAQKIEAIMSEARVYLPVVLWKIIAEYHGPTWKFDRSIEINRNDSPFKKIGTVTHVHHRPYPYSMNNPIIISGSFHHNNIHLWDFNTGEIYANLKGHREFVRDIIYEPIQQLIISIANDNTIKLWQFDNRDPKTTHCIKTVSSRGAKIALSPADYKKFASISFDGTLYTWSLTDNTLSPRLFKHPPTRTDWVAWNYDGSLLLSAGPDGIYLWNPISGSLAKHHDYLDELDELQAFACSPVNNRMAVALHCKNISLRDIMTGKIIHEMENSKHSYHKEGLAFSPSGLFLAGRTPKYSVNVWDVLTGELLMCQKTDDHLGEWVYFINDGTLLTQGYGTKFLGDKNGRVNVYSLDD